MAGHPIVGCLCIRADSSAAIGVGHVMRCLALSQAWIDQTGHVVFVTHAPIPAIEDRLRKENIDVRPIFSVPGSETDAAETAAIARDCGADWIAVDGYHFSADYHRALRPAGARLLSIDDVAKQDLSEAAVVLNQNVYAKPADYAQLAPLARLLLGTSHALLRREFSAAWTPRPPPARARRVLLTFGGSDPVNATEHMLTLLAKVVVAPLEITVIVGAANTHLPSLRAAAERVPAQHRVEIVETPPNLPERMAAADVALSAAGSTAWELATLGIPMILVVTAENHKRVSERLDQMGAALSLGNLEQASAAEGRSQIAQALA